jgi:hypothetical protein
MYLRCMPIGEAWEKHEGLPDAWRLWKAFYARSSALV